jgi:hypothetical protein
VIKQLLHKTFSVCLAVVVLFSTFSFTVEKHYCGNTLVDVSVFSEAQKCGMEMTDYDDASLMKNCCKDEIEFVQGQDELKPSSFNDLHFDKQLFVASFVYSYINLFEGLPRQIIPNKDYSPPKLVRDIQLVDQVFLI